MIEPEPPFRLDLMRDWIIAKFGDRCPDPDPDCMCCRAWVAYDELRYLVDV